MRAAALAAQLGGDGPNAEGWYRCPCPAHGSTGPSLAIKDGFRGRIIAKCWAGCSNAELTAALRSVTTNVSTSAPTPTPKNDPAETLEWAMNIWRRTAAIEGTPAETYLHNRGITIELPPSLRFAPRLWHNASRTHNPGIVAAVQAIDGAVVAVHRTWLKPDGSGKARVEPSKMAFGSTKGGAVRLGAGGDTLIVAEGIETALSAMQLFGHPAWAALSWAGVQNAILPASYPEIIIAADHDPIGLRAAEALRRRLLRDGHKVSILKPNLAGQDFNDVAQAKGRNAA